LMCTSNSAIESSQQDMTCMMTSYASKFAGQKGQGAVTSAVTSAELCGSSKPEGN